MAYSEAEISKIKSLVSMIRNHDTTSRRVVKKNESRLGWTLVAIVLIVDMPDVFILFWGLLLIWFLYMSMRSERQAQKIRKGYERELAVYGVRYTTGKFVLVESLNEVVRLDVLPERLRMASMKQTSSV